ncbi:MAG: hypothetical protein EA409_03590 [Saprospirales bacterium]|nr:MAG: hypothetical protein EA409_03590 [Saprospirales bacterium]
MYKNISIAAVFLFLFLASSQPDARSKIFPATGESSNLKTYHGVDTILGIPFPIGTQKIVTAQGIDIQLPPGYRFGGRDMQNNIHMISSGPITFICDCRDTSYGSCAPFATHQQPGCASDKTKPCNSCAMRVLAVGTDETPEIVFEEYYIFTPTTFIPGFTSEIFFIDDLHLWNQLDWADNDVFQNNEQLLSEILDYTFDRYTEGDLTVSVAIAIDSSRFLLEIPYSSLEGNMMYTGNFTGNAEEDTAGSCPD